MNKKEFEVELYVAKDSHRQPIYTTNKKVKSHHQTLEEYIKDNISSLPWIILDKPISQQSPWSKTMSSKISLNDREQKSKKYKITIEEI